ncbi:hypothetical protein AVEN_135536-1 [Araneus ventricosus]|uniref:Uncharacterized protein n=1 Tax=Araneus ventricosus TaxID=182803 RepID=A0A4Y2PTI7_ARAVE|nr:hypothetical protein AVEN_135536-1 [Araneus ventricosus]
MKIGTNKLRFWNSNEFDIQMEYGMEGHKKRTLILRGVYKSPVCVVGRGKEWRSDSHAVTALCHSESEVRFDGKGKLSRRRLQLPLAPAKGRFQISMSSPPGVKPGGLSVYSCTM